jgi:hypothetical protein
MPDPLVVPEVIGTAFLIEKAGGRELVLKLLGPTAEYLGQALPGLVEKGANNVARILKAAESKLGRRISESGSVSPRVLNEVLAEAAFVDNEVMSEYYGGILASSKTSRSYDDQGAAIAGLVRSLSSTQVICHYIMYTTILEAHKGSGVNLGNSSGRRLTRTFIPLRDLNTAMPEITTRDLAHAMNGLEARGLIAGDWQFGPVEHIKKQFAEAAEPGLVFLPSALGFELMFWANGNGDMELDKALSSELILHHVKGIKLPANARQTSRA